MTWWLAPLALAVGLFAVAAQAREGVPPYAHIFVIMDENKEYAQLHDAALAPNFVALAKRYGEATEFFGEVHPSEANYVALLGGSTFGIHDDDWFGCKPGMAADPRCAKATAPGYVDHTVHAPQLGDLLEATGQNWKAYLESLPGAGSLAYIASDPIFFNGARKTALYASKHTGFLNFADVQADPRRAEHLVDFRRLKADLASGDLPAFALVIPNQCHDMHGLEGATIPAECRKQPYGPLVRRGDEELGELVGEIEASGAWKGPQNFAIVITFDEGAGKDRSGCCGVSPDAISNFGGGHIPTLVITNHGPRGLADPTPYNHYSLLRTIEDAFNLQPYLGLAADTAAGVRPMTPLFAVPR
ncbi:MAG TPA: alkaline phosphatase family protein [Caulobacteraceae bacterium]|nr:alkaline phosphatase family protein [Caulobacteraceae bacterium]